MGQVEQSEKHKQLTGYVGLDFKEDLCWRKGLFSEKMASPSRSPKPRSKLPDFSPWPWTQQQQPTVQCSSGLYYPAVSIPLIISQA